MKRFTGILLIAVYILTSTECRQLLKFPVFIQHFSEHRAQNNRISLWDFMEMHYFGKDQNDSDHDRDMQLPFKSHENCSAPLSQFIPSNVFTMAFSDPVVATTSFISYERLNFQSSYLSSIWQPPKFC